MKTQLKKLKIIIGHYHLNPGGVTKIIQSQINGLTEFANQLELCLTCDGQGFENLNLPTSVNIIPNNLLGYLPEIPTKPELEKKVEEIRLFFMQLASKNDIIHFHNIGLGKNVALTFAMYLLAEMGYKVVNHAHDFPEDRPVNWQYLTEGLSLLTSKNIKEILYPSFPNYRFGVLNSFDANRLRSFGIPKSRIEIWPNPVKPPKIDTEISKEQAKNKLQQDLKLKGGKKIIAYPVRVIRRKNIGEYILLASLFSEEAHWIVTLPPQNPVEIEVYRQWVEFCEKENIPVVFEAGLKTNFETVMKGADVCFTTSIMEGFGMVFVEPWLWDTPVAGREISAVIPDLKKLGLQFPFMYNQLLVKHGNKIVDFPKLNTTQQMHTIKSYLEGRKKEFLQQNPGFLSFFSNDLSANISKNKSIITYDLSERKYGKQLYRLYTSLSS